MQMAVAGEDAHVVILDDRCIGKRVTAYADTTRKTRRHVTGVKWSHDGSELVAYYGDSSAVPTVTLFRHADADGRSEGASRPSASLPPLTPYTPPAAPEASHREEEAEEGEAGGCGGAARVLGSKRGRQDVSVGEEWAAGMRPWPVAASPASTVVRNAANLPPREWGVPQRCLPSPFVSTVKGLRNSNTVKGIAFLGPRSEYIAAGCDAGTLWIIDKATGRVVMHRRGDRVGAINCISPHPDPAVPCLLTSGLQHSAKVSGAGPAGGGGGGEAAAAVGSHPSDS
jgi:hypothetical protein